MATDASAGAVHTAIARGNAGGVWTEMRQKLVSRRNVAARSTIKCGEENSGEKPFAAASVKEANKASAASGAKADDGASPATPHSPKEHPLMKATRHFIGGTLGGMCGVAVSYPFDTVRALGNPRAVGGRDKRVFRVHHQRCRRTARAQRLRLKCVCKLVDLSPCLVPSLILRQKRVFDRSTKASWHLCLHTV